mmetsp:Transcript_4086/g.9508  ORF Transcript_4086/g.9508 Transcript_4086/m.9508 type:complete len:288 (-) Transcript_4086:2181-3044(-)
MLLLSCNLLLATLFHSICSPLILREPAAWLICTLSLCSWWLRWLLSCISSFFWLVIPDINHALILTLLSSAALCCNSLNLLCRFALWSCSRWLLLKLPFRLPTFPLLTLLLPWLFLLLWLPLLLLLLLPLPAYPFHPLLGLSPSLQRLDFDNLGFQVGITWPATFQPFLRLLLLLLLLLPSLIIPSMHLHPLLLFFTLLVQLIITMCLLCAALGIPLTSLSVLHLLLLCVCLLPRPGSKGCLQARLCSSCRCHPCLPPTCIFLFELCWWRGCRGLGLLLSTPRTTPC